MDNKLTVATFVSNLQFYSHSKLITSCKLDKIYVYAHATVTYYSQSKFDHKHV